MNIEENDLPYVTDKYAAPPIDEFIHVGNSTSPDPQQNIKHYWNPQELVAFPFFPDGELDGGPLDCDKIRWALYRKIQPLRRP